MRPGFGSTAGISTLGVCVGVTTREGESDVAVAAGRVSVGDLAGSVGQVSVGDFPEATGRTSGNDVAGGGSSVQAVRKSNYDRTPASRRFARERRAFKLAKFDKINLMAPTFIPDSDGRKAGMVP